MYKVFFIASLCVFSFFYGALSVTFKIFPYETLKEARMAWGALRQTVPEALEDAPINLEFYDRDGLTEPTVRTGAAGPGAGAELILVTGGPYQLMSHCPRFGCLAWIVDRRGTVRHAWPIDDDEPWGTVSRLRGFTRFDNIYPVGLHLYDNGDLLVSYQARFTYPYSVGLARLDKRGGLIWKRENASHHWFSVDVDGTVYTPTHDFLDSPVTVDGTRVKLVCQYEKIYEDRIAVLTPDGDVVREISVYGGLLRSGFVGVMEYSRDPCDPLHLNDVRLLPADRVADYPGLAAGDLLVSLRNVNAVAVLDPHTAQVKAFTFGKTSQQHSPRFVGDNRVLVFDNKGGARDSGGSRVISIDLGTQDAQTVFPGESTPKSVAFFSESAGHIDVHEDGTRALVSASRQGRVLEVDLRTGDVLWEYVNTHDIGRFLEAKGRDAETRFGRFTVTSAYYVAERPAFLAKD